MRHHVMPFVSPTSRVISREEGDTAEVTGIVWGWPSSSACLLATKVEFLRRFLDVIGKVPVASEDKAIKHELHARTRHRAFCEVRR